MENLGLLNWIFIICIIIGASLLVARILLQLIGAGHDGDFDTGGHDFSADHPGDIHAGHDGPVHGDHVDLSVKIFTLQGLMGFFLMFGLLGFVLNYVAGAGGLISTIVAFIMGFITMWLIARLFSSLMKLESSGTIDIHNAIGREGVVYQRILPGGTGKVQVVIQDRLVEYEATSSKNVELKTGDPVMIVYYKGNVLEVDKI